MKKSLLIFGLAVSAWGSAQVINTYPYNQNFEGEGASTACTGYTMLSTGWSNDLSDANDWVPDAGGTPSALTGPIVDYNPGNGTGKYMYTESSGCLNDQRKLNSPWFDLTGAAAYELSFAYHMYGTTQGTLSMEYRTGLIEPWTVLVPPMTDNIDLWQVSSSDITMLAGNDSVQFRFVAQVGTSFYSDMAIDDFNIEAMSFTVAVDSYNDVTCFGANDGEITVSASFGVPPFTYSWDNGGTTATISGLGAGTYCCTVTDDNGASDVVCQVITELATAPLAATTHAVNEWICLDSTGVLIIDNITGGVNITPTFPSELSTYACTGVADTFSVDVTSTTLNTTTTYPCPLGNFYWGNREQFLFRAAELNTMGVQPGNISGIAFYVQSTGTSTLTLNNWTIKMGATTNNNTLAWDNSTVEVLAPATHTITVGWNWFNFDTPYYWNGIDNLVLETCFNNSNYTENVIMTMTTPDVVNTSSIYYRADNATVCGASTITGTSTTRPVTQFINCYVNTSTGFDYVYSWSNGSISDTTYVPAGTYTLTVTDGVGCEVQETITISESMPVNIDDVTICETNPTVYAASAGFDTYLWSNGATSNVNSISTAGTYYVTATDSLGCVTSDTAYVSSLPAPVLAASPSPETYGNDGAIYLSIYGSAYPFMVDWDNDGTGDNDDTENLFYLTSGDYTVIVTDSNGCYTTLTVTVDSQVGVDENGNTLYTIYPNPVSEVLFIQPAGTFADNVSGQLVDVTGKVIETFSMNSANAVQVDMSQHQSGVYFIHILIDGEVYITKVVKE
ncbi:MAG: T9SS type A sorting domain-containing protein [Crocinitomicaceae bacterium]|nr:T9SS type A sorting domain-containing protein [Crocinitomicaceae bacterium]